MYSCEGCPFASAWQYPAEFDNMDNDTEDFKNVEEEEEVDNMYRRPPYIPGPYGRPRPYYPRPFYPRPFYPRPFYYPAPYYPRPFYGAPFLTGLALGGLFF